MKVFVGLVGLAVADPYAVWPRPAKISAGDRVAAVSPKFVFNSSSDSKQLEQMMQRYQRLIRGTKWTPAVPLFRAKGQSMWELEYVAVQVMTKTALTEATDESYTLVAKSHAGLIKAKTIYGARHAMETLYQMVQLHKGRRVIGKVPLEIYDKPRFKHRGLILDTSRNYFPVKDILRTLKTMGRNKMNVFHWHIVDSHSWPFQSRKHPLLAKRGAYSRKMVYSFSDIKKIVAFGMTHGVRVIPELEAPAHSYAMGLAYPAIATCMDTDKWAAFAAEPPSGQIDPTNPTSIAIATDLIDEFAGLFPDARLHLSGDEVNQPCWEEDPKIKAYAEANKIDPKTFLDRFALQMHSHATKQRKRLMVWEEMALNHNVSLPKDTLVQIWNQPAKIKEVIAMGYPVVLSSAEYWYLDCGRGGWVGNNPTGNSWCDPFKHWQRIYSFNLLDSLDANQRKKVAGGEVALWSEQADPANLDILLWPRASAAAEVLWSGTVVKDNKVVIPEHALPRLNNFRFRLLHHRVNAEPLQPLWCVRNPGRCNL